MPLFAAAPVPRLFFGEASRYSRGGLTASGERFENSRMTAAHKSLPFGSIVRVTNLENDKQVTLRINDRSAAMGAVIQLTGAAARSLGFPGSGKSKVEVQVVRVGGGKAPAVSGNGVSTRKQPIKKPDPVRRDPVRRFPDISSSANDGSIPSNGYRIQVGAFRRRSNADAFAARLRGLGYRVAVNSRSNGFHRVLVGPYATRSQAVAAKGALAAEAPAAFIRKG